MNSWQIVEALAARFRDLDVSAGDHVALASTRTSRVAVVDATRLALASLGAEVIDVVHDCTPAAEGQTWSANPAVAATLAAAPVVVDCDGLAWLRPPSMIDRNDDDARVVVLDETEPGTLAALPVEPGLDAALAKMVARLRRGGQLRIGSPDGTTLLVDLAASQVVGLGRSGALASPAGGIVFVYPAAAAVTGRLVVGATETSLPHMGPVGERLDLNVVHDQVIDADDGGPIGRLLRTGPTARRHENRVRGIALGLRAPVPGAPAGGPMLHRSRLGSVTVALGGHSGLGGLAAHTFEWSLSRCTTSIDDEDVVRNGAMV